MSEIMQWASFIRDIGVILGFPALIIVGIKLYNQQIEILKARNELLRETQYDRAVALLESQKKVFLIEREIMDKQIADLRRLEGEKSAKISKALVTLEQMMENSISITSEERDKIIAEQLKNLPPPKIATQE
jgi:Tfp pilus assembly protein PilN